LTRVREDKILSKHDLRLRQRQILRLLRRSEGGERAGDISNRLGLNKNEVRRHMENLLFWGFVNRKPEILRSSGRRPWVHTLTTTGWEWVRADRRKRGLK